MVFEIEPEVFYGDYMKFVTSGEQIKELIKYDTKEFGQAVVVSANCVKWWENGKTMPNRKSFGEIKKI